MNQRYALLLISLAPRQSISLSGPVISNAIKKVRDFSAVLALTHLQFCQQRPDSFFSGVEQNIGIVLITEYLVIVIEKGA
jgi:hypothetical protein